MARPDTIEARRAAAFVGALDALFASGAELPALPVVVLELQAALEDDLVTDARIVAILERDPVVAARVLRAANTAFFARGGDRVASLTGAVQRLGVARVRGLATAFGMVAAVGGWRCTIRPERFWRHSAAIASVARTLATELRYPGVNADELFVAGLLHDVGLLVLDQYFPSEFAMIDAGRREMGLAWWQQEEDNLGVEHGGIGGRLLAFWGLPEVLVETVGFHHRPNEAPPFRQPHARIVQSAELICACTEHQLAEENLGTPSAEDALARLGVPAEEMAAMLERLHAAAAAGRDVIC